MSAIFARERDPERIRALLTEFDDAFPRRISARASDLGAHARKLAEHAIVEVATRDDMAAGFIAFYANDSATRVAFLTHLAVAMPFRGMGIGLQLMRHCLETAKSAGMTSMKLEVDTANATAIGFYAGLGFAPAGGASSDSCFLIRASL